MYYHRSQNILEEKYKHSILAHQIGYFKKSKLICLEKTAGSSEILKIPVKNLKIFGPLCSEKNSIIPCPQDVCNLEGELSSAVALNYHLWSTIWAKNQIAQFLKYIAEGLA